MVNSKTLGGLLFNLHTHANLIKNEDEIVYREEDVIALLKALGFPEPEWGKSISLDEFKAKQHEREANKSGEGISY